MKKDQFFVYIMTKERNSTFYTGVTSNLPERVWKHKNGTLGGFTEKYDVKNLVYYEVFDDPENAIKREKQLKKWHRTWKMRVIEEMNPEWKDLYDDICK